MFRFETQSFFDFLNHVIRVFLFLSQCCPFAGGGGGGHNRKLDSDTAVCPSGRLLMHIFIVFIYSCIHAFIIYLTAFHTAFTARAKKSKTMSDFMKKPPETRD